MASTDPAKTLEEIKERNENAIGKLRLGGLALATHPCGDLRRTIAALDEALLLHVPSTPAYDPGASICPRCTWETGETVPVSDCSLRQAIMRGLNAKASDG